MSAPQIAKGNWIPKFSDHFPSSFSTATASSPTDVSAVTAWAKWTMNVEESDSLVVALPVVARDVNILHGD
jgi:hypothetical protein